MGRTGQGVDGVNACSLDHAYRTYYRKLGETIIKHSVLDISANLGSIAYSFELGLYSSIDFGRVAKGDALA